MTKTTPFDAFTSAATPLSWFSGLSRTAMDACTRGGDGFAKAAVEWQQEIARFTTARLQRDSEFGQKLLACRDWSEAMKLQQEWLTTLAQDYFDEGNRLAQLCQKAGSGLASGVTSGALKDAA